MTGSPHSAGPVPTTRVTEWPVRAADGVVEAACQTHRRLRYRPKGAPCDGDREEIVSGFDIHRVMRRLAGRRPIFHSEDDFKFALAWQMAKNTSDAVRLERPFSLEGARRYLDIWLRTPGIAIELKYKTRQLSVEHDGEQFSLKNQYAHDHGRYDFIKDIQRLEKIAADRLVEDRTEFLRGFAVLLTNDPAYWKPGGEGTIDEAFRIHGGRQLAGTMAWTKDAGEKTTEGRRDPLVLRGAYELRWRPYRTLPTKNGEFRYLAVEVG